MRGFSIIEVMLAMSFGLATIFAVAPLVFDTQDGSISMRRQANQVRAIYSEMIKCANWDCDNNGEIAIDGIGITRHHEYDSYFMRDIYSLESGNTRYVTAFFNDQNPDAPDTCNPIFDDTSILSLSAGVDIGNVATPVSGIDVVDGNVFVSTANDAGLTDDIYVYDLATMNRISSANGNGVMAGYGSIVVASSTRGVFAILPNLHEANFQTCSEGASCAQMHIVQIGSVGTDMLRNTEWYFKIPSAKIPYVSGKGGQAVGRSVYYYNGFAYLGLSSALSGPEFLIIDMRDFPTSPLRIAGFVKIGHGVEAIIVHDGFAYIATDDKDREVIKIDIGDKSNPSIVGHVDLYNSPSSFGNGYGNTLYLDDNHLFVGRGYITKADELYTLDSDSLNVIAHVDMSATSAESVVGMRARSDALFVVTTNALWQFDISDIANPLLRYKYPMPANTKATSVDCHGDVLYIGGKHASNRAGLIYTLTQ